MSTLDPSVAWVRDEEAPRLPPPPNMTGIAGWLGTNMFPSWYNGLLTVLFLLFVALVIGHVMRMGRAQGGVRSAEDRTACVASPEGACWAFVRAKFAAMDLRLLPDRPALAGQSGLPARCRRPDPDADPVDRRTSAETVLYLLFIYPIATLILLTGGHFHFSSATWASVLVGLAHLRRHHAGAVLRGRAFCHAARR